MASASPPAFPPPSTASALGGTPSVPAAPSAPVAVGESAPASAPIPAGGDDPILCCHCGRTARNGISCQGMCVADSGY